MAFKQSENPELRKMTNSLVMLDRHAFSPSLANFSDKFDPLVDSVRRVLVDNKALYELKEIVIGIRSHQVKEVFDAFVGLLDQEFGYEDDRKWKEILDVARQTPGLVGYCAALELRDGRRKPELIALVTDAPADVKEEAIKRLEELEAKPELFSLSNLDSLNEPTRKECRDAFDRLNNPSVEELTTEIEAAVKALEPKPPEKKLEDVPF